MRKFFKKQCHVLRYCFHLVRSFYFYGVVFSFKAEVAGVMLTLTAERIYRSKQSERYRLCISGSRYAIIVQTNRPSVTANKAIQWHLVEGSAEDKTKLEQVCKQLEKALNKQPSSFQGTLNFIDHF